jgi:hypothetical protein
MNLILKQHETIKEVLKLILKDLFFALYFIPCLILMFLFIQKKNKRALKKSLEDLNCYLKDFVYLII